MFNSLSSKGIFLQVYYLCPRSPLLHIYPGGSICKESFTGVSARVGWPRRARSWKRLRNAWNGLVEGTRAIQVEAAIR